MNTTENYNSGTEPIKASPDWMKSQLAEDLDLPKIRRADEEHEGLVELKYRSTENFATGKLAKGLGLFSIALGLAEVLAPAQMAGLVGVNDRYRAFIPALGAREIAHGIAIMRSPKPTAAVWTRVGGDLLDLAFLGTAMSDKNTDKRRLAGAAIAVLGVSALDVLCAQKLSSSNWSEADGNPMAPSTVGQPSARKAVAA